MRLLLLFLTAWLTLAAPAVAQPTQIGPQSTERIEAELVPMSAWAAPGSTAIVAVRQKIQPGWHTYWRNPGDSGGPTTLSWSLPQDVRAGDIVWPLPQRQRLQGLTNYGYEGEVFLPVPVEIPASARPGSMVRLTVEAGFFVCSDEMCVPDTLTLTLDLPIREGAAPLAGAWGRRVQSIVETAPRPGGITARATLDGQTLRLTATGGPLPGADLTQAAFFPYDPDVIDHAAAQFGQRGPQGVTLSLAVKPGMFGTGLAKGPVIGVLATDAGAWEITAEPGPPLPGASGTGGLTAIPDAFGQTTGPGTTTWTAVLHAALLAFLGGLVLNLMPCVFPVLAMKAASLTRAAHDPAEARRDGVLFTAGVLATFLALASVLLALRAGGQAIGWGFQLQSPAVVAGLALLMLAVALNLSGTFEIGAGLQRLGGSRLSRLSGGAGAFFTGMLAVVVAAPCTAPFMAFALGAALLMPAPAALAVFLMLGLGLALPYLAISLSPGLLRRLPRPGPWMVRLQRLLALPMFATTLWLVWVFARQTDGAANAWLAAACVVGTIAAVAIGPLAEKIAPRQRWAPIVGGLGMAVALMLAVLAVRSAPAPDAERPIPADAWSPARVDAALAQGRPVLVNFTADWCVSCKINERTALSTASTRRALERSNAVYLVADWTRRDDVIAAELARHGRSGVPLYLVYHPNAPRPRILPQLLTAGVVAEALQTPGPA
ncbi:protein-disulfide reductase DsbD family protein [Brevundimonas sp.]|uniref:protein-disulfide reductase DsbD family protein n=1 Tax=Brevundimonas sp. TaxID=1871086 RepID=UPI0037845FCE